MKFTTRVREIIKNRARGCCEVCGGVLRVYAVIHHRRPRGMGGSKREETGSAANGLWLHNACHLRIESNREVAMTNGWLVRQSQDPQKVPVRLYHGWYLLNADGGMSAHDAPYIEPRLRVDSVQGGGEPGPLSVGPDEAKDHALAYPEFGSDDVSRDAAGFGLEGSEFERALSPGAQASERAR